MSRKKKVASWTESLIDWSRSNQASSVVAGLGVGTCAILLGLGYGQMVAFSAGAAIILIVVPIANAIR